MVRLTLNCFSLNLRTEFVYPNKKVLQWFPGHMGKGLKQMENKLKTVDCVIEVHDSRIPISGRNPKFKNTVTGLKPHILVLNKTDLSDLRNQDTIERLLQDQGINKVIYTNCKDEYCPGVKQLVPTVRELIINSKRYNRSEAVDLNAMIIGIPNVGKSSIINALRNRFLKKTKAAPVGAIAGLTRSVTHKIKVSQEPLIYILDTPGILSPNIHNLDEGLKLALCSSMLDHLVGTYIIADYLLYFLNLNNNFSYVNFLGLKEPSDEIMEVLVISAVNLKKTLKTRNLEGGYNIQPDIEFSAQYFIKAFRNGEFGKVMLDKVSS